MPRTEREVSPTPSLYNSAKLCKPFRYMDIRGINGTAKREEVVDIFREGKFELLPLMETKLKGNGDISWCGVSKWHHCRCSVDGKS